MTIKERKQRLVTTITGPQAQALRLVMGKFLTFRVKNVAGGKETVMEVCVINN